MVANPKVEPNVSSKRFFAATAVHCGTACRSFDGSLQSLFPFATPFFVPLLKVKIPKNELKFQKKKNLMLTIQYKYFIDQVV